MRLQFPLTVKAKWISRQRGLVWVALVAFSYARAALVVFSCVSGCKLDESGLGSQAGVGPGSYAGGPGSYAGAPGSYAGTPGSGSGGSSLLVQDDGSCALAENDEEECGGEILIGGVVQGGSMGGTCRGGACCLGCWDGSRCRYLDDSNCSDGVYRGGRFCAGPCPEGTSCQISSDVQRGRSRIACSSVATN